MSQLQSKKLKSDDSQEHIVRASEYDVPEVEHVETACSADEPHHGSNRPGKTISHYQSQSKASAPSRPAPSARAALRPLTKTPQSNFPYTPRYGPSSRNLTSSPTHPLPVKTTGQLGVQNLVDTFKRGVRSVPAPFTGPARQGQQQQGDRIGFSYLSKPPRWLIMPATLDAAGPEQYLQWVFDPGPSAGWPDTRGPELYEIGYQHLKDAYADPGFRDSVRSEIRRGPFALNVANVEDPLPLLPPQPDTFARTRKWAERRTRRRFHEHSEKYHYRDYERPSLASRPYSAAHGTGSRPLNDRPRAGSSDTSSDRTLDGSKFPDGRYSGSSDLERQRTRVPARFALDEIAYDAPLTPIGPNIDHPMGHNELVGATIFNYGHLPHMWPVLQRDDWLGSFLSSASYPTNSV